MRRALKAGASKELAELVSAWRRSQASLVRPERQSLVIIWVNWMELEELERRPRPDFWGIKCGESSSIGGVFIEGEENRAERVLWDLVWSPVEGSCRGSAVEERRRGDALGLGGDAGTACERRLRVLDMDMDEEFEAAAKRSQRKIASSSVKGRREQSSDSYHMLESWE